MDQDLIVIDAHVHFWNLSLYAYPWPTPDMKICKTFLHKDLLNEMQSTPVKKAVHVQVNQTLDETEWMLESAEKNDFIAGVVGWVDLTDPELDRVLEKLCKNKRFVGCRHIVEAEPDDEWLARDDVQRGLGILEARNLTYDLLLRPQHLKLAEKLVQKFPNLTFVLDHIAKPPIKEVVNGAEDAKEWMQDIAKLAKHSNVYCKLSSLITQADLKNWKIEDLRPFVQHAIKEFGVDRCMFGSDWPVAYLANIGSYKTIYDTLVELLSHLSTEEKAKILGENSVKIYKLQI